MSQQWGHKHFVHDWKEQSTTCSNRIGPTEQMHQASQNGKTSSEHPPPMVTVQMLTCVQGWASWSKPVHKRSLQRQVENWKFKMGAMANKLMHIFKRVFCKLGCYQSSMLRKINNAIGSNAIFTFLSNWSLVFVRADEKKQKMFKMSSSWDLFKSRWCVSF